LIENSAAPLLGFKDNTMVVITVVNADEWRG